MMRMRSSCTHSDWAKTRGIGVMNKQPDGTTLILDVFREGQCFPNQAADTLPEGGVHPLNVRGAAGCFAAWTVAFAGQDSGIGGPKIRLCDRTLAVHRRQQVPQLLRRGLIARPKCHTDNVAGVAIQGQPEPLLMPFGFDKRPEFVAFEGQSAFLG